MARESPIRRQILDMLSEHGAVLVRSTRHAVWRLPSGAQFVFSNTPSEYRTERNTLSNLRHVLGLVGGPKPPPPPKPPKEKKEKPMPTPTSAPPSPVAQTTRPAAAAPAPRPAPVAIPARPPVPGMPAGVQTQRPTPGPAPPPPPTRALLVERLQAAIAQEESALRLAQQRLDALRALMPLLDSPAGADSIAVLLAGLLGPATTATATVGGPIAHAR